MAKLTRQTMAVFAGSAGSDQIAVFGSLAEGSPQYTTTPATIAAQANYAGGWFDAVIEGNSPAIEDMNALQFLFSYQLAYLMQEGIPEYDAGTTYYEDSICQAGGILYTSILDNNTGHTPASSPSAWSSELTVNAINATTFASTAGGIEFDSVGTKVGDYNVTHANAWTLQGSNLYLAANFIQYNTNNTGSLNTIISNGVGNGSLILCGDTSDGGGAVLELWGASSINPNAFVFASGGNTVGDFNATNSNAWYFTQTTIGNTSTVAPALTVRGDAQALVVLKPDIGINTHPNFLIAAQYNIDAGIEFTPSTVNGGSTFSSPVVVIAANGAVRLGPTGQTPFHQLNTETSPSASTGSNGALPAQVAGYIEININGVTSKIPYYNN